MNTATTDTTLICLFHDRSQADATLRELSDAGISKESIGVLGDKQRISSPSDLDTWQVPQADRKLLLDGIQDGGVVIAVRAPSHLAKKVEDIFERNEAGKIDEKSVAPTPQEKAPARDAATLDVIEESLVVGKRAVDLGGVRIFQRIVEKPVSQDIQLHEEHVHVERQAVDRPATSADFGEDRVYEMRGTGEEAVVAKSARVVEEVKLQKEVTDRTETVQDTLHNTEVIVENVGPGDNDPKATSDKVR